jgi:hypothetical protein
MSPGDDVRPTRLWLVGLMLVATACVGSDEGSTTSASTLGLTTSTSVASTSIPKQSTAESLLELLGSSDFSAEMKVTARIRAPGVEYTSTGAGAVAGSDSMLLLESDFSQLTYTIMDTDGNLLGPGGQSSLVEESRLVDGILYQRIGDRWVQADLDQPDTAVGHVFATLREVTAMEDLGTVTRDGEELYHFRPGTAVEYEPIYFDIDPDDLTTFVAVTHLYVDEAGVPRIVEVEFGLEHVEYGTQVWTETYELEGVGAAVEIERPPAWISPRTLGIGLPGLDLLVPADWSVVETGDTYFSFLTPDGYLFSMGGGPAGDSDAAQMMREFAAAQQSEILETKQVESLMFLGEVASVTGPNGEVASFYTTVSGGVGIVAVWISPDEDSRTELFEEVVGTLVQKPLPDDMLVPGESIGSPILQADVMNLILVSDPPCEGVSVVYTKYASTEGEGWSEDWYLESCGVLKMTRVSFTREEDGIGFAFTAPFDPVGVSLEP